METRRSQKDGFSLTEVLLAVATLAVGMIFIAGAFPVALHFSTEATERTIAAVVADEAFAKIRLIAAGPHPDDTNVPLVSDANFWFGESSSFEIVVNNILSEPPASTRLDDNVFAYPSLDEVGPEGKSYFWSAICRRTRPDGEPASEIQATVFVCRKVGMGGSYWFRNPNNHALSANDPYPGPIYFDVSRQSASELVISDLVPAGEPDETTLINEGYMIVDSATGEIYRVLERRVDNPAIIVLDRPWQRGEPRRIWAVPAAGKTRYPCIAVYQKVMRF
ncbi:MAG TPA: hypothetical protein VMX13_11640 [Sedimentisphaerales bacterium]|nr:hypothetical protein [Sedimentisphaerales bacterium]